MKRILLRIASVIVALLIILGLVGYTQIFGFTRSVKVRGTVFLVYNSGGFSRIGANVIAIDAGDAWVVFDTHLGPLAKGALGKIKSIKNAPVRYVFNSHWHPDHSGGNVIFTGEAEIVAHQNTGAILSSVHEGFGLTRPGSYRQYKAVQSAALPETLIGDQQKFEIGTLQMDVVHYPAAHTNGDLVLYADQLEIVALGDLVWPAGFPFVDVHNGGSAKGIAYALKDILARTNDQYVYLMGHGTPYSAAQMKDYILMVDQTIAYVAAQKASGKSLKQIQAQGLPEKWLSWETRLNPQEQWIRMIFETL